MSINGITWRCNYGSMFEVVQHFSCVAFRRSSDTGNTSNGGSVDTEKGELDELRRRENQTHEARLNSLSNDLDNLLNSFSIISVLRSEPFSSRSRYWTMRQA